MSEKTGISIPGEVDKLATLVDEGDTQRKKLLDRAMAMVDGTDFTSPEVLNSKTAIEGRMMLLKGASDIIADREKSRTSVIAGAARAKDVETNETYGKKAVDFLRNIPLIRPDRDVPAIDVSDVPLVLSDEEQSSISPSTLKTDSSDLEE